MFPIDSSSFINPPNEARPLQIVHSLDRHLSEPGKIDGDMGIGTFLAFLQKLGLGGVVTNIGGYRDYLQNEQQWTIWRHAVAQVKQREMSLWIYDELGYPSGSAGGVVTRACPEYSAVGLACYAISARGAERILFDLPVSARACAGAIAFKTGSNDTTVKRIDLRANVDDWGTLRWTAPAGEWTICYFAIRGIYEGTFATTIPLRQYIDVLNPDAVKAFIRVTHQAYLHNTPPDVWKRTSAFFTDEPLLVAPYLAEQKEDPNSKRFALDQPFFKDRPPSVIWTPRFADHFKASRGYDIRPHLLSLFTGDSAQDRYVRQDYWQVVTDLYTTAFHQQIADWCASHRVASSGHVLAEEDLYGSIMFEGNLMAAVRPMQIPGIDMLSADPAEVLGSHIMAAKTVSSAAHLAGRKLVQCETSENNQRLAGIKTTLPQWRGQANGLFATGVNVLTLYHPLNAIGEDGYRAYTDYVGRLGLMLRGGRHVCDVAVMYPVRSGWCWFVPSGKPTPPQLPNNNLGQRLMRLDERCREVCLSLVRNQIDFDMIDEHAIRQATMKRGRMRVADESYRVIILPGIETLSLTTVSALEQFAAAGGTVLFVWQVPDFADSRKNQRQLDAAVKRLSASRPVPADSSQLAGLVRESIDIDFALTEPDANICYLHRYKDGRDIYFIVNNNATAVTCIPRLRVPGPWKLYRPIDGTIQDAPADLRLALAEYEGVFLVSTGRQPARRAAGR